MSARMHIVTGAFGYSGRFIAQRLIERGIAVRTLTNSPQRANAFGGRVEVRGFDFDRPERLAESLRGAHVLYNTYWVRFNHRARHDASFTHSEAVRNTRTLFEAARRAGVERIVHVSITNPSKDSPLEYFRGKAELERALRETGVPHSVLRPAVLFGAGDILVNNIAWALRRLPVFGVFGDGGYRLQPIHVEDFAELAVREGALHGDRIIDAVGPETFTFRELVKTTGAAIGRRPQIIAVPPWLGFRAVQALGRLVGDVILTREEIAGLMAELLVTSSRAAGTTRLSAWARENAATIGVRYASELGRRRDRTRQYDSI